MPLEVFGLATRPALGPFPVCFRCFSRGYGPLFVDYFHRLDSLLLEAGVLGKRWALPVYLMRNRGRLSPLLIHWFCYVIAIGCQDSFIFVVSWRREFVFKVYALQVHADNTECRRR